MGIEYEARYWVENKKYLLKKLEELGFKNIKEVYQKDIIFIKDKNIFRIRISGNKQLLEYKQLLDNRRWEEISLEISDWKKAVKILSKLVPLNKIIEKRRQIYKSNNFLVEICIDDIKCLGTFIEIEGKKEDVEKLVKLLNLKKEAEPYGKLLDNLYKQGKVNYDFKNFEIIC